MLYRDAFRSWFYVPEPAARGAMGQGFPMRVVTLEALHNVEEVGAVGIKESECDDHNPIFF